MMSNDYEWQQELKSRYPDMLAKIHSFEHGKGWKNILEVLFDQIQRFEAVMFFNKQYRTENDENDWSSIETTEQPYTKIIFAQIKEKFGGIRIYYDGGDHQTVRNLVREAENIADITCESCGSADFVKKHNNRGWIYTSCDNCKRSNR